MGFKLRVAVHLGSVVVLWTLGIAFSDASRSLPLGAHYAVPIPLVLGLLASIPSASWLARTPVQGNTFRHRLACALRQVPLATAASSAALTGILCAVLCAAGLIERAVYTPRLLLVVTGCVLILLLAFSGSGRRRGLRHGVPSAPPGATDASAMLPGAPPHGSPAARDRRPVFAVWAWAAPLLAVPAGFGVVYVLAYACEGSEAMSDFKGMGAGLAIIGLGFVPLLISVPTSLVLAIVSLVRRERCPGLAVSLLAAYGAISGFLLFGPLGLLAAYIVVIALCARWLARRAERWCAPAGATATGRPRGVAEAEGGLDRRATGNRFGRLVPLAWKRTCIVTHDGPAGQAVHRAKGNAMTGKQVKIVAIGGGILALWIGYVAYIEIRSERGSASGDRPDSAGPSETNSRDTAATEVTRLESEEQARRAVDAEAVRLEQERRTKLAADEQAARLESERQAQPAADAPAEHPDHDDGGQPAAGTEATPPQAPSARPVAAVPPGGTPAVYRLTGIMGGKGQYGALLNNRVYQAGDRLGSATVLAVEAKAVTVETAAGTTVRMRIGDSVTIAAVQVEASAPAGADVAGSAPPPDSSALPPDLRRGLLAYYPFSRDEGSRVSDTSDSHRGASVENAAWIPSGKVGGAMAFNPKGSRIIASDQGLPAGDAPRSIAFWKKTGPKNEVLTCMLTYGKHQPGQNFSLGMDWRVGRSGIFVSPDGSCNVAGQRLANERWYHVVYCYGGGGKHTVYINGETEPLSVSEFSTFNTQLAGRLMLGDSNDQAPSFDGCMDEVMIYDRVLSPDEVRLIYERR